MFNNERGGKSWLAFFLVGSTHTKALYIRILAHRFGAPSSFLTWLGSWVENSGWGFLFTLPHRSRLTTICNTFYNLLLHSQSLLHFASLVFTGVGLELGAAHVEAREKESTSSDAPSFCFITIPYPTILGGPIPLSHISHRLTVAISLQIDQILLVLQVGH